MNNNNIFDELQFLVKTNDTSQFVLKIKNYTKIGFDVNHTNEYGNTLMHIACRCRNFKAVSLLIKQYDAKVNIQNNDKRNALHFATIYGSSDIAYYICIN